jgi:hypothetical protein
MGCGSSKHRDSSATPVRLTDPDQSRVALPPQSHASQYPQYSRPPTTDRSWPSASSSGRGDPRRPSSSSYRGARRPSTSASRQDTQRLSISSRGDARRAPKTSYGDSRRPSGSSRGRPATSNSASGRPSRHQPKQSSHPVPIPEGRPVQYTEDRVIVSDVSTLNIFIDQHAENFYLRDVLSLSSSNGELNDPRSRNAAIRQYLARTVIDYIVMADRDRYE